MEKVISSLNELLANTFTLYLKTHNYHWNVKGVYFPQLHKLFEKQYEQLWLRVDAIAERIRALKGTPVGTLSKIYEISNIDESDTLPGWQDMVKNLTSDREKSSEQCKTLFKLATESNDDITANFMLELAIEHDKAAWMLRSIIEE